MNISKMSHIYMLKTVYLYFLNSYDFRYKHFKISPHTIYYWIWMQDDTNTPNCKLESGFLQKCVLNWKLNCWRISFGDYTFVKVYKSIKTLQIPNKILIICTDKPTLMSSIGFTLFITWHSVLLRIVVVYTYELTSCN